MSGTTIAFFVNKTSDEDGMSDTEGAEKKLLCFIITCIPV